MFHRPNRPIVRSGGREMHNALAEGNGIAKHTACRYGNVNPPQVAFLSALSIDRRVYLFSPLPLLPPPMLNHVLRGVRCNDTPLRIRLLNYSQI